MTQWLASSFSGLPSDRHRHMFLDAATLLEGQPLQELRSAWTPMVQVDDDLVDDPVAAAYIVDDCLAELVASSLISISTSIDSGGWIGLERCVMVVFTISLLPVIDPCLNRYDVQSSVSPSDRAHALAYMAEVSHGRPYCSIKQPGGDVMAGSMFTTVCRQWHTRCPPTERMWLVGR